MTLVLSDLVQCLVECSQKAAKIAQVFREQNDLFDLIVQEKSEVEKNKRFLKDFKTLADVLVQETIKKDVGEKFPELVAQIRGEENNQFQNSQEECVEVVLTDCADDTVHMLQTVLDGKRPLAETVARIVHSTSIVVERQCTAHYTYPIHKLGIWIDPIDSTAEFVEGKYDETQECGFQHYGLNCACVLIGAYDLETYSPVLGVINQPFYSKDLETKRWKTEFYWGMSYENNFHISHNLLTKPSSNFELRTGKKVIVISSSENPELIDVLKHKYELFFAAGSGYKSLLVAVHKADLYVLSKSSTYFWDTCAPHAILKASGGGGMLRLKEAVGGGHLLNLKYLEEKQVKYENKNSGTFQNYDGIIAYRDPHIVLDFITYLNSVKFRAF